MTDYEKKQEILQLFDQLTPEEQEEYVEKVREMLIQNARKAEFDV